MADLGGILDLDRSFFLGMHLDIPRICRRISICLLSIHSPRGKGGEGERKRGGRGVKGGKGGY